jgi:hypothetical protein
MHLVLGIALILLIVAAAVWAGRTPPSNTNGSNTDAAIKYGPGSHL